MCLAYAMGQLLRHLPIGVRAMWGAGLIFAPVRILPNVSAPPRRQLLLGARALGARELLQAIVLAGRVEPGPPRWSIAVDATHAASMFALAAASRRWRRDALLSAILATTFAATSARAL